MSDAQIIPLGKIAGTQPLTPERRAEICQQVVKWMRLWAAGQIDGNAVFVVFAGGDAAPSVGWYGGTEENFRDARLALSDARFARMRGRKPSEAIKESWEGRRKRQEHERRRAEAERAAHPWECDHCPRRFKTERGAVQHERTCWKNPDAVRRRNV